MKHTNDCFVYEWTNSIGKRYIGYHKGDINDGYICSSGSSYFWNDWNDDAIIWTRSIIAQGSSSEMILLEKQILKSFKHEILEGDIFYNNSITGGILFTKEVRQKISEKAKKRPSGFKGKRVNKICCIQCKKIIAVTQIDKHYKSKRCLGIPYHTPLHKKYIVSNEHKEKISIALTGRKLSRKTRNKMSKARKGRVMSKSTKEKISTALTGQKNPAYGTIWITNGIKNSRHKITEEIPFGWGRGRKISQI